MTENTETGLIAIPEINLPAVTEITERIDQAFKTTFTAIVDEIKKTDLDVNTPEGRANMKSLAYKIRRTKTGLDGAAKGITEDARGLIDGVNSERNKMKVELDKLIEKVRAPLTAYEEREKVREKKVEIAFMFAGNLKGQSYHDINFVDMNSDQVRGLIEHVRSTIPADPEVFQDRSEEYDQLIENQLPDLTHHLVQLKQKEDDAVELAALRAQQEAAEQKRRDDEAAAAKKAAEDAEKERLRKQAAEIAQREAQEKLDQEKRKAAEAERKAAEAEEARIAAEKQAEIDRKEAEAAAERQRKEAAAKAERERKEAIENERRRAAEQAEAERAAEEARAADLAHRRKFNSAAVKALMKSADLSEPVAKIVVTCIAEGKIPAVKIEY